MDARGGEGGVVVLQRREQGGHEFFRAHGVPIYALCGPDVYLLLVEDRGWTPDRYQDWLAAQLIRGLLREATYVIMLSAKGQQIDRERGLLGGADEYMTKPFSPREVAQRVRTIMAERAA